MRALIRADYSVLAARIAVSNLHKQTKRLFSEAITDLYEYVDTSSKRLSKVYAAPPALMLSCSLAIASCSSCGD